MELKYMKCNDKFAYKSVHITVSFEMLASVNMPFKGTIIGLITFAITVVAFQDKPVAFSYKFILTVKSTIQKPSNARTDIFLTDADLFIVGADSRESLTNGHSTFFIAMRDFKVSFTNTKMRYLNVSTCPIYNSIIEDLTIPFKVSYQNGVLTHIEVSKEESDLSASIKLHLSFAFNINSRFLTAPCSPPSPNTEEFVKLGKCKIKYNANNKYTSNFNMKAFFDEPTCEVIQPRFLLTSDCPSATDKQLKWNANKHVEVKTKGMYLLPSFEVKETVSYEPRKYFRKTFYIQKDLKLELTDAKPISLKVGLSKGSRILDEITSIIEQNDGYRAVKWRSDMDEKACSPLALNIHHVVSKVCFDCLMIYS